MLAGTEVNMTCDYTLSPSVDTHVTESVRWMVNGSALTTSTNGRISSRKNALTFSPLSTSDGGTYTCIVTVSSPKTLYVMVQRPQQSVDEVISVKGIFFFHNYYSITFFLFLP